MGRKKRWKEDMQARFSEGTFDRIAAVLVGKEDRTDFVRDAVAAELRRREKKQPIANVQNDRNEVEGYGPCECGEDTILGCAQQPDRHCSGGS